MTETLLYKAGTATIVLVGQDIMWFVSTVDFPLHSFIQLLLNVLQTSVMLEATDLP